MRTSANFVFGPSIPASGIDVVEVAFVSAPHMEPGISVAGLTMSRYVLENFPHVDEILIHSSAGSGSYASVGYFYGGTNFGGLLPSRVGQFSISDNVDLSGGDYKISVLNSPIRFLGFHISRAGSWHPLVSPGRVVRKYIVPPFEPETSWLIRSGLFPGDEVYLIYSLPEIAYRTLVTEGSSSTFPGSGASLERIIEYGSVVGPSQIHFSYEMKVLYKIEVNGVVKFSGIYDGTKEVGYIRGIDQQKRIIDIADSLNPDDIVVLTYLSYPDFVSYHGYRDYRNEWYTFDANPESGHWIADPASEINIPSQTALVSECTLYLIPSAYMVITTTPVTGDPSGRVADIAIQYVSAYDYGETHFLRHWVGRSVEDIVPIQKKSTRNTWGHAVFGINVYDEGIHSVVDIFSRDVPSMLPIARIVLTAPASASAVQVADMRRRGGGVPMDFPMVAVSSLASEGVDKLRSHWDLGLWDGQMIKEGGVIEIKVSSSILEKFTKEEVEEQVRMRVPPGIYYVIHYV